MNKGREQISVNVYLTKYIARLDTKTAGQSFETLACCRSGNRGSAKSQQKTLRGQAVLARPDFLCLSSSIASMASTPWPVCAWV